MLRALLARVLVVVLRCSGLSGRFQVYRECNRMLLVQGTQRPSREPSAFDGNQTDLRSTECFSVSFC